MNRKKLLLIACICLLALGILEYKGLIWHNNFFVRGYEVKGLDVSHYQGNINWKKVADTADYQFVYIKATEGRDFLDDTFSYNWNEASKHGFAVGAYHFFTTQSTGLEQAQHFIATVPATNKNLPPVIDIEIGLDHNVDQIRRELTALGSTLEEHYGKQPLLYVTYATYNKYIAGAFENNEIWIRDIVKSPSLQDDREWSLWQYNNRGRVDGIEAYVDINVFRESQEAWHKYVG